VIAAGNLGRTVSVLSVMVSRLYLLAVGFEQFIHVGDEWLMVC
jgi:hypothetical protein